MRSKVMNKSEPPFLQGNARPHTPKLTREKLTQLGVELSLILLIPQTIPLLIIPFEHSMHTPTATVS